jgi:SMC interacting uncharacterized protein involved in chromosome segregation
MIKKGHSKKKKTIIPDDKIQEYKIEFEKLKDELAEHEKNMAALKQEIAGLKKIIKLGSTARNRD